MVFLPCTSSFSLGAPGIHDVRARLDHAVSHGFKGIELFFGDLEHIAKEMPGGLSNFTLMQAAHVVKYYCTRNGLKIVNLQPFCQYEGLLNRGDHAVKVQQAQFWFRLVHILGTDLIHITSNFLEHSSLTSKWETIVGDMIELADLGLQEIPIVRFAYESLAWGTFVNTWESAWDVVRRVDRQNFGLCLDTFNIAAKVWADPTASSGILPAGGENLRASMIRLADTMDPSKLFFVQVADAQKIDPPLPKTHSVFIDEQRYLMNWSRDARLFPHEVRPNTSFQI